MTALEKIRKTAKGLQRKNPKLKWVDAIKKASVIYNKEKKPTQYKSKTTGKWKALKPEDSVKELKKYKYQLRGVGKKKAVAKKSPVAKSHKDTKSHNVNIRVVSGAKTAKGIAQISTNMHSTVNAIAYYTDQLRQYEMDLRIARKNKDAASIKQISKLIRYVKYNLAAYKKHLTELKKFV